MAGLDVGNNSKRSLNHEIPLIPFIDFLLCLVSFLLITAVWSQMARINADARVPGSAGEPAPPYKQDKVLHVEMKGERKFTLLWKEGSTVVNSVDVERRAVPIGSDGEFTYPDLAKKIAEEWNQNGSHRGPSDFTLDQAVLHTDNSTQFDDIIAVIDAIHAPQRQVLLGRTSKRIPALNLTFAVN
ncbi:MAG TPA: biopolymer transporter ExbD [Polyangiaceae bacterium]|nr:biopolymer transporter ExbD [Polyangiaceae bacterium]